MGKKFGRRIFITGAGVALIGTGGYFVWDYVDEEETIQQSPIKDLQGNAVQLDVPITDSEKSKMNVKEEITTDNNEILHVKVPSVKMNTKVGEMSVVDGVINPPDATRIFIVRNMGTTLDKASDGTIYLVTHSLRTGFGPGNYLIDVQNRSATLKKDDEIYLGDLHYKVSSTELVDKSDMSSHENVWKNTKKRLVFITCLQREEGKSLQNLVIYADLTK